MSDHNPSTADPLGQIADEFVEAFRQGKRPSVEEFARRYPDHADELRDMLPALVLMEKAKTAADAPGHRRPAQGSAAALPLQQLGDYQILREVGRGGMGVVYEAQQLSLGRHVAIKVLPSHALLDARQLGRFQREARSAARLHHTNIVPVFGVGEHEGLHYYVMQFIQGLGLDVVLDELRRLRQPRGKQATTQGDAPDRPTPGTRDVFAVDVARGLLSGAFRPPEPSRALTTAPGEPAAGADVAASSSVRAADASATIHLPGQTEASTLSESGSQYWQSVARVGMQVADALAHAASQGVLHRDIKPSNLLLDDTGNVWVTDFGLAKAAGDGDDLTHTGDVVGTLRYMAPERFNGQGDLRSDVYSLGLTLYELLTLRPAFDERDRNRLVKEVMHGEPVRPRKVNRAVPRDLQTVVLKAIARDPAHRYQTPADMAEDLKRFVEDRPVKARRISNAEKLWRWCRRNPLPASLLAAIVLVFLTGFAGVAWQWHRAETAREEEKDQRGRAEALQQGAETARDEANQARAESEKSRAAAEAETYRALLSEVRALRAGHEPGWREKALGDLARLAVMPPRDLPELRTEAAATLGTPDVRPVARVALPSGAPDSVTFSPDGRTLLTACPATGLDFWDVPGNRHLSSVEGLAVGQDANPFDKAVYLPDGQGLAVATRDGGVVFTDMQGSRTTRAPITQGSSRPIRLAISTPLTLPSPPAAGGEGRVRGVLAVAWTEGAGTTVHDSASGALLERFKDANPTFALSPDGKWLAREENADIVLLPIASGEPRIVLGRHGGAYALAFSPNGALLAVAFADHTTVLWDVAKREQLGTLRGHREKVFDVAFSPDGGWIATGGLDYTTRIWDTRTGQNVATLPGFSSPTFRVKWSPTGDFLAVSLNNAREVLLYKVTGRHHVQQWLTGHGVELNSVAAHPFLDRLTTSGYTELNTWDLSVSRPSPVAIGPNPGDVTSLAYSPNGSLLAIGSGPIVIRDANTGKVQGQFSGPSPVVYALAFDPAGGRLASGDLAGNVILWDLATSLPVQKFVTGSRVNSIVFLDHPRRLATHGRDAVLLFNLESGKLDPERKVDLAGGGIRKLVANRERSRLVVGFENGAIGSLSLPDLTPGPRLEKAHEGGVAYLALSPDGRLLATGSDHRVVLRDALSLEPLLRFPLWDGTLRDLTFDCTGRRLAIVGTGNDVDLWDLDALRAGLTEVGLAWDRPPPPVAAAAGLAPEGEHLRPAVPVLRRPGSIDPAAFEEARRLVQSGVGAFEGGRWVEAIRDLQQARDRLRTLHQAAPGDGQVAGQLAISLGYLGSALRNEHRPAEALASVKESCQVLEAIRQPTFVDLYNLACAYANLTTLAEPGSAPTAADREALAERALEALRRSIRDGMTDFAFIERDPDLDPLRERPDYRALILESSGRTREAVAHLAKASTANPKDTLLSLKVAALQAWFGQDEELAASRQRILAFARGTDDADTAERAARACSILPSTDKAEREAALALGRAAVKLEKDGMWNLLALGRAEYRSGNDAAAEAALRAAAEAGKNTPCVTGSAVFYRALSLFRQGKPDEARQLALAAAAKMKPLPADEQNPLAGKANSNDLILWLAYKEAKAVIQFDPAPPAKAENDKQ
jgi:eukaryotic-like serine/threonine-protein kinase